ncbi:Sperm vesicle fusion protein [Dirofilaria immitis]
MKYAALSQTRKREKFFEAGNLIMESYCHQLLNNACEKESETNKDKRDRLICQRSVAKIYIEIDHIFADQEMAWAKRSYMM